MLFVINSFLFLLPLLFFPIRIFPLTEQLLHIVTTFVLIRLLITNFLQQLLLHFLISMYFLLNIRYSFIYFLLIFLLDCLCYFILPLISFDYLFNLLHLFVFGLNAILYLLYLFVIVYVCPIF
jgi:hypothetical protein